jgi:hypothetical protein
MKTWSHTLCRVLLSLIVFISAIGVISILIAIPSGAHASTGNVPTLLASFQPIESLDAPAAESHVCATCPYTNVQAAVDAANPGDTIKVATGVYTGVQMRGGVTQTVYLSKTVTIQGGYATTNWITPNPEANPTTLDAQGQGRVLYITGSISPTIAGLRITGGNAAGLLGSAQWNYDAGGGVYVYTATATINACRVFSNASAMGGGLYLRSSSATLQNSHVTSNTATAYGGGLYLYNSDAAMLKGNQIISNTTASQGGGLYLFTSDATLITNTVTSNTANQYAGLVLDGSNGLVAGNTIANNHATSGGGGVYLRNSNATLAGNIIASNTAGDSAGVLIGYYISGSGPTLTGNTIVSNTADYHCGGVHLAGPPATLISNTIAFNTAANGYGGGLYVENTGGAKLIGNMIRGNTAGCQGTVSCGRGGGAYLYSSSNAGLKDNIIISNTAVDGGGLNLFSSSAQLNGNVIMSNTATNQGGGVHLHFSDSVFTNTVIADNQANVAGSGLYMYNRSRPRLLHTTIARNRGGDGSGVHVSDSGSNVSVVTMTNTILVNQAVGITVTAGYTATLDGVLWYGNVGNTSGAGFITVSHAYTGNPAFAADGYHLTASSAAIDKGLSAGVRVDIDGESRPQGAGNDLGADEFPSSCIPLTDVNITGPNTTDVGSPVMLNKQSSPANATTPITYAWSPPPRFFAPGTHDAVYYWNTPVVQTVMVAAQNCGATITATHRVTVTAPTPVVCVKGTVTHAATPLPGVKLDLLSGGSVIQTTTTNSSGAYRFCSVPLYSCSQLKWYGPAPDYVSVLATSICVGHSSVTRNLDMPKKTTLLAPANGATLTNTTPLLTWQALPTAGNYTLQLNFARNGQSVLKRTGQVTSSYQVDTYLSKGLSYFWQVDAYTGTHWVGATTTPFYFTVPMTAANILPPAHFYSFLRIDNTPMGLTVNKLIGDADGPASSTLVEISTAIGTDDTPVYTQVHAILTIPGNLLGAPLNTWLEQGEVRTPVTSTSLGGGRYRVTITDLQKTCSSCAYGRVIVWRFRIPTTLSPQELKPNVQVQVPGYQVNGGTADATLRLVNRADAIVITNHALLHHDYSGLDVDLLLLKLRATMQGPPYNSQPLGVIYNVDWYSTAATNWDNTNVNYTSETTANVVANEIDALIEDWVEDSSGSLPQYLLVVGDDNVIPYYRYDDPTDDEGINTFDCDGNRQNGAEHPGWCVDSHINPAIHATEHDFLFTDNPYGDTDGDWDEGELELAVGRIVGDSAADMLALLNSGLAAKGSTGRAVMASVDGTDLGAGFVNVPARLVDRGLNVLNDDEIPRTVDVNPVYPTNWNAGFRAAANGGMDIFYIGSHASYRRAIIPGDAFSPDDTCAQSTCGYSRFDDDHPLAFIDGCHGGLTVPNVDVPGGVDNDMVYDLTHEGARAYIGATGFSYFCTTAGFACCGEVLIQDLFSNFLSADHQSLPIGEALRWAKEHYVAGYGGHKEQYDIGHSGYRSVDYKTLAEYTLYGVPWQRLKYPDSSGAAVTASQRLQPTSMICRTGSVIQANAIRYTRTITVEIAAFDVVTATQDNITYDLLTISGGGMALAPGLPMLPYVKGYTLTLPLSATLQGMMLTGSACAATGSYQVPNALVRPRTEGGTSYTTTTSINTFFPANDALIQAQQQGNQILFTLFPIQHNPTTNETRFCNQMVFEVSYDASLTLAVSDLHPQQEQLRPGETITATARVENVGSNLATFTYTLAVVDVYGHVAGWQDGGPFSVMAGGQEQLDFSWDGLLDEGGYTLELTLWQNGAVVGLGTTGVNVVGGAITHLQVPETAVMPGQQATFTVTFANYLNSAVTTTARLVIYDQAGDVVRELGARSGVASGQSQIAFTWTWQPLAVPGGAYTAWAVVQKEDEISYGPTVETFQIGHLIYLPIVLRNMSR